MSINAIGMSNNAAFSTMKNNNAMMNLMNGVGEGSSTQDLKAAQQSEKSLLLNNVQNNLIYNASLTMEETEKKLQDENIKRTFSAFA